MKTKFKIITNIEMETPIMMVYDKRQIPKRYLYYCSDIAKEYLIRKIDDITKYKFVIENYDDSNKYHQYAYNQIKNVYKITNKNKALIFSIYTISDNSFMGAMYFGFTNMM